MRKRLLILGMGNEIVGDDGVGIHVSDRLAREIPEEWRGQVDVEQTPESYMALLDYMQRYERIVIVDAMRDDKREIGSLRVFEVEAGTAPASRTLSSHGFRLESVIELAGKAAVEPPARVAVYAVNIDRPDGFRVGLSPAVRVAAGRLVARILDDLPALAAESGIMECVSVSA